VPSFRVASAVAILCGEVTETVEEREVKTRSQTGDVDDYRRWVDLKFQETLTLTTTEVMIGLLDRRTDVAT
jgi:hypothetical protein